MTAARERRLVLLAASLFVVSTAFPVVASLIGGPPPRWLGVLDVAFAAALALTGIVVATRVPTGWSADEVGASLWALRTGSTLILILLTVYFVGVARLQWEILLVGLAWRVWLLVWVLPSAVALWMRNKRQSGPP